MQIIKITTRLHFILLNLAITSLPQNVVIKIETPAAAIIATTAGRREFKIPCNTAIFRYFKYNLAISVTIIQDGKTHPNVATIAPKTPAIFMPTKVAELMAIGPGVI